MSEIIEISGNKFEVDLTSARRVTEFKIGSKVKLLKKGYSNSWVSLPGVVVGFDPFPSLPTAIIACLIIEYSGAKIELVHINEKTEDYEICPATTGEELLIDKGHVVDLLDREITKKLAEVDDLRSKKDYFLKQFGQYFPETH